MKRAVIALAAVTLFAGCATPPPDGPSVMVLPGSGKSFDQFRFDDNECRQFALAQLGGTTAAQASNDAAAKNAVVGTAIGAAAGGLMGGNSGAAVGAGIGLAGGALAGTGAADYSGRTVQQRYDIHYQQCMYAKGHQIPMAGRYAPYRVSRQTPPPPPPPPAHVAPPPPPPQATSPAPPPQATPPAPPPQAAPPPPPPGPPPAPPPQVAPPPPAPAPATAPTAPG